LFALLIGIDAYHADNLPKLQYAVRNVNALRELLVAHYGFPAENIITLTNERATKDCIQAMLSLLTSREHIREEDSLLIYFCGLGKTMNTVDDGMKGFLLPVSAWGRWDALPEPDQDLIAQGIPMNQLWKLLDRCPAQHILLIADAGIGGLQATARSVDQPINITNVNIIRPARQVLADGAGFQVDRDTWESSLFSEQLLRELRTCAARPNSVFTAQLLYAAIDQSLAIATNGARKPQLADHGTDGDFSFTVTEPLPALVPPANAPLLADTAPAWPAIAVNPKDGAEMVLIPAGEFLMGSTDSLSKWRLRELPQHRVYLDAYYIYKNPVTVAQFRKYQQVLPSPPPQGQWRDNQAMSNLFWDSACGYAKWAGASLPSEAEWEKAARGIDGRHFPWGNTWDDRKVSSITYAGPHDTAPSGSCPEGASPYGVLGMVGNIDQACADWFDEYAYLHAPWGNPVGPATGDFRVVRGIGWSPVDNPQYLNTTYRSVYHTDLSTFSNLGFRCVVHLSGQSSLPIAKIQVTSDPSGAEVFVNGAEQWQVTPCPVDIYLGAQQAISVSVEAHVAGYQDASRTITLKPGELTPVSLTLEKLPAKPAPPLGPLPPTRINPRDGAEMMLIPEGEFLMGSTAEEERKWTSNDWKHQPGETPQHRVFLDDYYIYKTEVTVTQYKKFCAATGRRINHKYNWDDTYPVEYVSWQDAYDYAEWANAALPSEAEWEKAARGTDGRRYPWGDELDTRKCPGFDRLFTAETAHAVGIYPGNASPYGVLDMAGNVNEWCTDWYQDDFYTHSPLRNPLNRQPSLWRVYRGGNNRAAARGRMGPDGAGTGWGFRCVVHVTAPVEEE